MFGVQLRNVTLYDLTLYTRVDVCMHTVACTQTGKPVSHKLSQCSRVSFNSDVICELGIVRVITVLVLPTVLWHSRLSLTS